MIVPRTRLLIWTALVALPFSFLAAVAPSVWWVGASFGGALLAVVFADAWVARRSLAGISLILPEVVRLSKDRPVNLELRIRNASQRQLQLKLALPLPRAFQSSHDVLDVILPNASEWSRLPWPCIARERGNFHVTTAYLEGSSPLGFWGIRRAVPAASELRVYPNLSRERNDLAALFLNRGFLGLHAQRQIGKGKDFEKLREYSPGDGFDEIHWKATARRGHPVTKVFQIERTQEIYVIIDHSRLSARTHPVPPSRTRAGISAAGGILAESAASETTVLERYITAGLVLGLAAEQQGDLFGVLTFAGKVGRFVRARNGASHYNACRDALYTLEPESTTPDFDELCTFIRLRLRRRALLIFLTSLDDPIAAASFVRNMDLICRQHLILVNMLQPIGVAPLFTQGAPAVMDDLYGHLGGHLLWQNLRDVERSLQRRGVRFSLVKNERLSADLVSQYLNVKRRQML